MQKIILGSITTKLIISNKEMEDITKTVKTLEETGLMIKCVSETVEYQAKEQKSGFPCYQMSPDLMVFIQKIIYLR